jgi:hypothetical protein
MTATAHNFGMQKIICLSKTDYLMYRECKKNAWLKIHRPAIFQQFELSEFDKAIIATGNEVEIEARKLFSDGVLIEKRDSKAQEQTLAYIASQTPVVFQAIFLKDNYLAALDILQYDPKAEGLLLYEVKASSHIKEAEHLHDLAFQYVLLEKCKIVICKLHIIHLNSKYVRFGAININELFVIKDVTDEVRQLTTETKLEMEAAQQYLSQEKEPTGHCDCINKGRSRHCTTFYHSNPDVPKYGVHDIARIGSSKAKLAKLAQSGVFKLEDLPPDIEFSTIQKNQIDSYIHDKLLVDKEKITEELNKLAYPLYFLDYETYPAAIPRFDGFSPYQQIPFQYSLHILEQPNGRPRHEEYLSTNPHDPSSSFAISLRGHIGEGGTIVVWNKTFESKINEELSKRIPQIHIFMEALNNRIYDLMDVFSKQYYVHKDFQGGTSIKDVLPVLASQLSYKDLAIQEGGTASQTWDKITSPATDQSEKENLIVNLKAYCERDTYAMYAIWQHLYALTQTP